MAVRRVTRKNIARPTSLANLPVVKVQLDKRIIDRKDWIKYLVIPEWHVEHLGELIERAPDAAFNKFIERNVNAYLKGKNPPKAIQSAVMNIADDYIAGRDVTMRAGDYIALQGAFRAK